MSSHSIGEIKQNEGRFPSDVYLKILEELMIPTVHAIFPERVTYMQARCPMDVTLRVRQYLESQPFIDIMEWPSHASDLKSTENLLGIMVNE